MNSNIQRRCTAVALSLALTLLGCAHAGEIHEAAVRGELEKVKALLKENPSLVNAKDEDGLTPLLSATFYRSPRDPSKRRGVPSGWTQEVFEEVYRPHVEIARLLLENKANVNARAKVGWTAIGNAAAEGHQIMVELLIQFKADLESKNIALSRAAAGGQEQICELLLKNKADPNWQDEDGETALWDADRDIAVLLLKHGADPHLKNKEGKSFYQEATERTSPWALNLLHEQGVKPK